MCVVVLQGFWLGHATEKGFRVQPLSVGRFTEVFRGRCNQVSRAVSIECVMSISPSNCGRFKGVVLYHRGFWSY